MASSTILSNVSTTKTLWGMMKSIPIQYPFAFGVVVSGLKTSFSDLLVQKVVEQREEMDWRRNAAFATFGFVYLGGIQYMIYVPLFQRIFPNAATYAAKSIRNKIKDGKGTFECFAQVFLDQCIHHPLMYFPAFYITKELVINPNQPNIIGVLNQYKTNMREDLVALWKIWVPSMLLNFAFMPMYARIPWVASTSLLWTCILSAMRGGDVVHGEAMVGGAVTGTTFHMIEEGLGVLFMQPVELDRTKTHLVITASGPDQRGLVANIARVVADAGGNVTHSKMVRLGSEFIILMHVAIQPGEQKKLMNSIKKSPQLKPLHIQFTSLTRRLTGSYHPPTMGIKVRCIGADKPGMLATIAESLSASGLSIENITTELQRDRYNGQIDFAVEADCVIASNTNLSHDELHNLAISLESLKQTLHLHVMDVRIQHLQHNNS